MFVHIKKKVAGRYVITLVFSAPGKLAKICSMLTRQDETACSKKDLVQYTDCVANVVYEIPLNCGKVGRLGAASM